MKLPHAGARALLATLALLSPGLSSPAHAIPDGFVLELQEVLDPDFDFFRPVGLVHAGDGSDRLFVVQQDGRIWVMQPGADTATLFLDLGSEAVFCCGERGLLGLAFHPDYEVNGFLYVYYSAEPVGGQQFGDSVVSRFTVSADPNVADAGSELELLRQPQPAGNHNGGQLAFGPDGYLYISLGDGGGGGDPQDNAQDLSNLLGKILRIDVDAPGAGGQYSIPPDNPFVGQPGVREEIWVYGLRNPWRFSFDRQTGHLYIADVGQGQIEEVNFLPAGHPGGANFGWRCYEGSQPFNLTGCGPASRYRFPILEYGHGAGDCSVTGGYRYRGPDGLLEDTYLYGDFCSGRIWGATPGCGGGWRSTLLLDSNLLITSFGEGEDGAVYLVGFTGFGSDVGRVFRLVAVPTDLRIFLDDFELGDLGLWRSCQL
jgi:hypothetical protein